MDSDQPVYEDMHEPSPKSPSTYSEAASIPESFMQSFSTVYNSACSKLCNFDLSPSNENIVAFFWAAMIFFVGLTIIVAQYTTTLSEYNHQTTYWMLFVIMWLANIGLSIAIRSRSNKKFIKIDLEEDTDPNPEEKQPTYLIGNAYIFAGGNFLLDMFSIVTVFHCSLGMHVDDRFIYLVKLSFHLTRIIFTSLQLVFIQIFTTLKVSKRYKLQYKVLVVHVIATNFLIWFTFLCEETGILKISTANITSEYSSNCSSTPDDQAYKIAKDINKTLQPFVLEFSLLAASLLYSLCPLKILSSSGGSTSGTRFRKYYGATDHVKRDDSKRFKCDPGLLFGIFLGLFMVISSWSLKDVEHYIYNLRFNYSMQIIMHVFIIISCAFTLREFKKYHSKNAKMNRKYRIDDYLLLITGPCGVLPFLLMVLISLGKEFKAPENMSQIISASLTNHEQEVKGLLGFLTILTIVSVLVQTFFLLEAHSYDRVAVSSRRNDSSYSENSDDDGTHSKLRSAARIGQWLLLLLVLNVTFWITDTFFECNDDLAATYGISVGYWEPPIWSFITKLLYPIMIFFRFHSVAVIVHIWFHFQVKRKFL